MTPAGSRNDLGQCANKQSIRTQKLKNQISGIGNCSYQPQRCRWLFTAKRTFLRGSSTTVLSATCKFAAFSMLPPARMAGCSAARQHEVFRSCRISPAASARSIKTKWLGRARSGHSPRSTPMTDPRTMQSSDHNVQMTCLDPARTQGWSLVGSSISCKQPGLLTPMICGIFSW